MKLKDFKAIALAQTHPLLNYAFPPSGSWEGAEDLVQSTFERSLRHSDRFPDEAAVRLMMFRILHNPFVNHVVAEQRGPVVVSLDEWKGGHDLERLCVDGDAMTKIIRNSLSDEVKSASSRLGAEE